VHPPLCWRVHTHNPSNVARGVRGIWQGRAQVNQLVDQFVDGRRGLGCVKTGVRRSPRHVQLNTRHASSRVLEPTASVQRFESEDRLRTLRLVNPQPFGGWKRSSVDPTAKAGRLNHVNALRSWPELTDSVAASGTALPWWNVVGSQAIDRAGLTVEKNFQRYRRLPKPVVVRIDASFSEPALSFVRFIADVTGVKISFSATALDARIGNLVADNHRQSRYFTRESPLTAGLWRNATTSKCHDGWSSRVLLSRTTGPGTSMAARSHDVEV
jgi:hypothetical protein